MKPNTCRIGVIPLLIAATSMLVAAACGVARDDTGSLTGLHHTLADGMALFGYRADDNRWFLQHATSTMGVELNRGRWTKGNEWKPMTTFTVGGKQYIMGHRKNGDHDYFIQEIYTTGDIGRETDTGTWHFYYDVLIALQTDTRTFIYGSSKENSDYWFVQEVLPGGKLGGETDSGEWGVTYDPVVALPLPTKTCMFMHTSEDDNFYKTMCLTSTGELYEQDEGHWAHHWQVATSYRAGDRTYLFTHRHRYDAAKAWYMGPWSIVHISDTGDVWGDTDSGEWGNYYKTMTVYFDKGSGMYYLAGMNTDKHFFIQHVTFAGTMGAETDSGHWGHYFDYFLPVALDPAVTDTDDWMGQQIDIIGDRKLTEIALPGSHDAGMNVDDPGDCYMASGCNTVTQQGDIAFQLDKGSRFFDLRPVLRDKDSLATDPENENWRTGHTAIVNGSLYGCKGEERDSIVHTLDTFFSGTAHKSELVILKLSHCILRDTGLPYSCSYPYHVDTHRLKKLAENLAWHLDKHLVKCDYCTLTDMTLNEILQLGNVVLVVDRVGMDGNEVPTGRDPPAGIFNYCDAPTDGDQCDFIMYDKYASSNNYTTMLNNQTAKLLSSANHQNSSTETRVPFLFSWTLTLDTNGAITCSTDWDIIDYSMLAQWRLYQELHSLVGSGQITKTLFPNILYVDDFNGTATRSAVWLNEQYGSLP